MSKNDNSNDISLRDMYEGINADANTFEIEKEGETVTCLGTDYQNLLFQIDKFVTEVASTNEPGFSVIHNDGKKPTIEQLPLGKHFKRIRGFLRDYLPDYDCSENVNAFYAACKELCLFEEYPLTGKPLFPYPHRNMVEAELFNSLITLIRTACRSKEFKAKSHTRVYNATRNFRSTKVYVDRLFKRHSRLMVMRIDFGYRVNHVKDLSIGDAQKHLKHLFNNMRNNKLFAPLLGHIWRRECGKEKGLHFHVVLFYDGSLAHKDEYIASQIGEYWNDRITGGKGVYFNCNKDKLNRYKRLGIGMIHHAEVQKREHLLEAVQYLTKKEVLFRPKADGDFRAYGKGNMPNEKTDGPGRPRTVGIPETESDVDAPDTSTNED